MYGRAAAAALNPVFARETRKKPCRSWLGCSTGYSWRNRTCYRDASPAWWMLSIAQAYLEHGSWRMCEQRWCVCMCVVAVHPADIRLQFNLVKFIITGGYTNSLPLIGVYCGSDERIEGHVKFFISSTWRRRYFCSIECVQSTSLLTNKVNKPGKPFVHTQTRPRWEIMNAQPSLSTNGKFWIKVLGGVLMFLANQRRLAWTRTRSWRWRIRCVPRTTGDSDFGFQSNNALSVLHPKSSRIFHR
jgi:hypothetical protein